MSVSMNIHPNNNRTWERVSAEVFGENSGNCVNIHLDNNTLSLHYGDSKNKNDFILKLKEAINNLPCFCDSCKQDVKLK